MSDSDDPTLELLLREHFSAELDGQLGRGPAAFRRHFGSMGSPDQIGRAAFPSIDNARPEVRLPDGPPATSGTFSSLLSRFGGSGGRLNGWFIGLAGAALAASLAALWAAPVAFRRGAPVAPIRTIGPKLPARDDTALAKADDPASAVPSDPAEWNPSRLAPPTPGQPTLHWVRSRAWDEGTVVLDDPDRDPGHAVPARKIREQQLEHTQWYDPARHARVEMTVPRQNVKFVDMDTY